MNFQSIRRDFNQQVKEQTEAIEAEQMRNHLAEELERKDRLQSRTRYLLLRHLVQQRTPIELLKLQKKFFIYLGEPAVWVLPCSRN